MSINDYKRQRVAITGMGITCAIGQSIGQFRTALKEGKTGIRSVNNFPFSSVSVAALLDRYDFTQTIELMPFLSEKLRTKAIKSARHAPLSIQTSMTTALESWHDAILHEEPYDSSDISVVIGGNNINQRYSYEFVSKFHKTPEYLTPQYGIHFMDTDHVGTISELLNIHGEGFCVGGASASGNMAMLHGYRLIKYGFSQVCLVVGALSDLSPMELQAFCNLQAMGGKRYKSQPEKACRPFDENHEGFIFGHGCGCLVLETESSAKQRGARIYAELAGAAMLLDGNRLADPSQKGESQVMKKALKDADICAEEIDYLNAHGTSSPLGDYTEIYAIKEVFRSSLSKLRINSTKGLTGHCLCSSGVIEAIATIVQMDDKFIHPNANLEYPIDKECLFAGKYSENVEITKAMSNSFGFGGINTSIILRKVFI